MTADTIRPSSSQLAVLSIEDMTTALIESHDAGDPHFATMCREYMLEAYRRGMPSDQRPIEREGWSDAEVTRDTGARESLKEQPYRRKS